MSAPLTGVRVVELGAYTTGPLCARYLSNLGAEIIKVEHAKRPDNLQLADRIVRDGAFVEAPRPRCRRCMTR